MKTLLISVFSIFILSQSIAAAPAPKFTPVSGFAAEKYLGTWYEIARIDWRFERGLVNVTANYSLKPDGTIRVLNQGYKKTKDGKKNTARGNAKFTGAKDQAHLKVSFFWPFYADYIVVALDTVDYQYALVAGSSHDYLWILSRTPQLDAAITEQLLKKATELGFDTKRLYMVPQDW